jgi:ABC-type bacteriocin/lantibiotic exporter with double-glycine peptidase domain
MVGERGVRLSGGQRQRIGIARALYHNPPVLVLDEATSALDQLTEQGVMNSVKLLKGKTVIIVAHRYSTIEHCDWIIKLSHGKLVSQGPATEILHS